MRRKFPLESEPYSYTSPNLLIGAAELNFVYDPEAVRSGTAKNLDKSLF